MHTLDPEFLRRAVRVLVVGCGGSGSVVASGLPYLHQAMLVAGHPGGLHVTIMDGDIISPANCVRQPFSSAEIGLAKTVVMVSRLNLFWGLNWTAVAGHLTPQTDVSNFDITIGCVDMFVNGCQVSGRVIDLRIQFCLRHRFDCRLQHCIGRRLAVDFLLAVACEIGTDLVRRLENCFVDRPTFSVLVVNPEPVTGHELLASTEELKSPAKRPVACLDAVEIDAATVTKAVQERGGTFSKIKSFCHIFRGYGLTL